MSRSVAVLMGGWSSEREVSLVGGRDCAAALEAQGYRVRRIDVTRDLDALLAALTPRPDVALNALLGTGGEDGTIHGVLEFLRIPYTHSGVLASAVAMHKPTAKAVFAAAGLPLAEGRVVSRKELAQGDIYPRPFVVKPAAEGSSVGVRIVRPNDSSWAEEAKSWAYEENVVERFIPRDTNEGGILVAALLGVGPLHRMEDAVRIVGFLHQPERLDAHLAAGRMNLRGCKVGRDLGCRAVLDSHREQVGAGDALVAIGRDVAGAWSRGGHTALP